MLAETGGNCLYSRLRGFAFEHIFLLNKQPEKLLYRLQETAFFFRKFYQRELTVGEQMEFLNLWYILIVINDSMIILGSIFKMEITTKVQQLLCLYWLNLHERLNTTISV